MKQPKEYVIQAPDAWWWQPLTAEIKLIQAKSIHFSENTLESYVPKIREFFNEVKK